MNGSTAMVRTTAGVRQSTSASLTAQTTSALSIRTVPMAPEMLHMLVGVWVGTVMISGLHTEATVTIGAAGGACCLSCVASADMVELTAACVAIGCSWVQTGIWGGDAGNTCLTHHELAGTNPGWGSGDDSVAAAGYMDWIMCCGGQMGTGAAGTGN